MSPAEVNGSEHPVPLLTVDRLSVEFGAVRAVADVSFRVARGERVGIVGESGSGKSTLALSILQLLPPTARVTSEAISVGETSLGSLSAAELRAARGSLAGMVFQDPLTSFDPLTTIGGHLRAGLRAHGLRQRLAVRERSTSSLRDTGMPDPAAQLRRYPHQLSGGMRQRSMIALAVANEPQLLIADEPTTALDVTIQAQILELFGTIGEPGARQDMGLLIVSHNLGLIRRLCHRVIVMYGGAIVEDCESEEFFGRARHPYSIALQSATPRLHRPRGEVRPIAGQPVDLTNLPIGCSFAPRCASRLLRCESHRPPLETLDVNQPNHRIACWNLTVPPGGVAVAAAVVDGAVDATPPAEPDTAERDAAEPLVVVSGAAKSYAVRPPGGLARRKRPLRALDDVQVSIAAGATLALVGESGSGKSTLAHAVLGLTRLTAGTVTVGGEAPHRRGNRARTEQWLQAVFQDPHGSLNAHLRVADIVAEPLVNLGTPRAQRLERVAEVLDAVRIPAALAQRRPHELSGGQAQRVAIARALAPRPRVIVLDEPTASLDVSIQTHVVSLLRDLQVDNGLTYLFVSHDLAAVREIASTVAVMYLGRVVELAPWRTLFSRPQHPYSVALLSAVPGIDDRPDAAGRIVLRGEPPSATAVPAGCAFHPRCPVGDDRCTTERPALRPFDGSVVACHHPGSLSAPSAVPVSLSTAGAAPATIPISSPMTAKKDP